MSGKADMEIMGVKGLWGLERLARSEISTGKLALLLMVGSVTATLALMLLVGGDPEPFVLMLVPDADGDPEGIALGASILFRVTAAFGLLIGFYLSATVALARWTQADLAGLLGVAPEIEPSLSVLRPTRGLIIALLLVLAILNGVMFNLAYVLGYDVSVIEVWSTRFGFFSAVVQPLIYSLAVALLTAVIIRQVMALTHAARRISIDVLELEHYPRLANSLIRYVIFSLVGLSFLPILGRVLDSPANRVLLLMSAPVIVVIVGLLIVSYAYPLWVLRGRISAAKDWELECVFRSLRGDEDAMGQSRMGDRGRSLSFSELLDYRTFIESLWDWPVAPHLQKVLLIGLLPPTTWVLAALIENAVAAAVAVG